MEMDHFIHDIEPLDKQILMALAQRFEHRYGVHVMDLNLLWTEFMLYTGRVYRKRGSFPVSDYSFSEDYLEHCQRTGKRNFVHDFKRPSARTGLDALSNRNLNLIYPLTVFFECMVGQYAYTERGWFDYDHRHGQDMDLLIPEPVTSFDVLEQVKKEEKKEKRAKLERIKKELEKTKTIA